MKKFSLSLLFLGFLMVSCKNPAKQAETETVESFISQDIPSSFMSFYERFHNEEDFQMSRISFPLSGQTQDGETREVFNIKWQREDWVLHKPFNSHGGTFVRDFFNLEGIIIEKIQDTSGNFSMERRFNRSNGEWHLIFYGEFQFKG